jgi:hypothetical protein
MTSLDQLRTAISGQSDRPKPTVDLSDESVFALVLNPFGRALVRGVDLNAEHARSPEHGTEVLSGFVEETRQALRGAIGRGAQAIVYVLEGASPDLCTPMQYGGLYLEWDREMLSQQASDRSDRSGQSDSAESLDARPLLVLYVSGGDGTYLDIAADLPADLFSWDAKATGVSATELRHYRKGALCADDPDADVLLEAPILVSNSKEAARA